ncbi:MAG: hypothetical protein AAGJ50_10415 [Pseudomonadota bacterium]
MARIGITAFEPPVLTAPSLVWFEAKDLEGFDVEEGGAQPYDPSFDGVTYVWTVEGGNLAPYTAPNIPTDWNTPTRAYGKKVAFVFTDADTTYTIRLWAIDESGNIGEARTLVKTVVASDLYPGAQTVCLDPSGGFQGAPDRAAKVTTLHEMQSALLKASGPTRLLVARGQVLENVLISGRRTRLNYIGSFGDPGLPRPVLWALSDDVNMLEFQRSNETQITVEGLDCRGHWDAATETGRGTRSPLDFSAPSLSHFTVWRCRFSGFGLLQVKLNAETVWTGGLGDTEVTNWGGYGIYVQPAKIKARLAFVGCDVAQHPDALNHYPGGRNGLMNTQGPIRIPECASVYFGASSFLSRTGWSGSDDQSCLRLNSSCLEGHSYIIERCTLEGGWSTIHMSGSNGRKVEKAGNYLLDKVLLLAGGGKSFRFGSPHFGGTTLRNTLMVQLDVPGPDKYGYVQSLHMVPQQTDRGNLAAPVAIYNCSVMNLRSPPNVKGDQMRLTAKTPFEDFTDENNIIHAPRMVAHPEDTHAPVATTDTLPGFKPRYKGIRPNFNFEEGVLERAVRGGEGFQLRYPEGTDQAYWLGLPASDRMHGIRVDRRVYRAVEGTFQVRFDPKAVTIINLSRTLWEKEWTWILRLDRKSQIPPINTTFGSPTDREMPLPVPAPGSPAILTGAAQGRHAYDDFLGRVRPGPSETGRDHKGDPRPRDGGTQGALHI